MAEEKKGYCHGINTSASSRVWGHNNSPFFKLSAEVRNMIYDYTFTGSDIALSIDPPLNVAVVPATGRRSVWKDQNMGMSTFFFLLTCAQVYTEALGLYWGNVIVRSGCDSFSRGFFLSRIPDIARPFIKHLRNVNAQPFRGRDKILRGRRINWPWNFAPSVDFFPRLKTVTVSVSWAQALEIQRALSRHPAVQIAEKKVDYIWGNGAGQRDWKQIDYVNHTSGKTVSWVQSPNEPAEWYIEDSCFDWVLNPARPASLKLPHPLG